jgi:hypothetical protein
MLVGFDRRQQFGCTCLVEGCPLEARKFNKCRSSDGDDCGAIAKFRQPALRRDDIERLIERGRCAQRHLRAAGNVPRQPAADIPAIAGVRRTAVALVDDDRWHRSRSFSC